jgi:ElaB/YqjD/DUF883 family membrane-anchored ribosome-binding protein
MIKNILQILVVVVVGVLVYNFFLGTPEEKQNARTIFNEVKDVGVAVKDLLQSEKEKFDAGKYDNALDQIGNLFDNMKTEAREFDEQYLDRIEDLERKRRDLERKVDSVKDQGGQGTAEPTQDQQDELQNDLRNLMDEAERIIQEMDRNKQ